MISVIWDLGLQNIESCLMINVLIILIRKIRNYVSKTTHIYSSISKIFPTMSLSNMYA